MTRKQILYGAVAIAAVALLVAAYFVFFGGSGSNNLFGNGAKLTVDLNPTDHTLGSPKAPVQFVEYGAPSCPHCAHWNEEVFPILKKNYIDTGKVYYVFRVFPLSSVDVAVEAMARCLPKESYFQFIDMMFRNQDKWDPDGYDIADVHAALINMGRIAGMSAVRVDGCISNQADLDTISQVGQDATRRYGINGTPTFIVNGYLNKEAVTPPGLRDTLNGLLRKKNS